MVGRHSNPDPKKIAYHLCFGSADTSLTELVRVTGSESAIEECFQTAKNGIRVEDYQGGYTALYRHATLSMAATAFLTILRRDAERAT